MVSYSIRNIIIGYAIAIAVVLMILVFTFYNLRSQGKELVKITKARDVLQKLEPGLMDIQEFESDMDNLLFFGKSKSPNSYNEGLKKLQEDSMLLAQLGHSYPENREEYRQLANLIHEMTGFSAFAIYSYEMKSPDTATNEWQKKSGRGIVTEFKTIVGKLEEKNRKILSESYGLTMNLTRSTLTFVSIISGVLIIALLISFLVSYRDIRNRLNYNRDLVKQVNKKTAEISKSEEKYRIIIEQAPDGIFISGGDTFIIDANNSGCSMLGYAKEELQKMKFTELITPESIKNNPIKFDELRSGNTVLNERKLVRKDGSEISVEISAKLLSDGRYQSFIHDITERKKTEENILKSGEQYRDLVNNITDLICTHDLNGRVLSVNSAAEKLIGYKFNPQENLNIKDILTTDTKDKFNHYLTEIKKKGHAQGLMKVQTSTGEIRIWEYNNSLKTTGVKNPIVRGYARDITERKKAEDALRESEDTFRRLFNESADPILLLDDTGFTDCNQSALSILGYSSRQEVFNKKPWEISPEKQPDGRLSTEKAEAMIAKALQQGYNRFEWIHTKSDGTEFPVEVMLTSIILRGKQSFYALLRDITEREKAKQEILDYKHALDKSSIVVITDQKGIIRQVNENFCKISKYSAEELIDQDHRIVNSGYHPKSYIKNLWATIANGKTWRGEFRNRAKDRTIYWVNSTIVPFLDDKGKPYQYVAIQTDITERKKAEEELKQSNDRFEMIAQTTNDAIWEWNFETNEIWGNEMHQNLYGLTMADPVPDQELWKQRIHPDDREKTMTDLERALASRENVWIAEYRFRTEKGGFKNIYDRTYILRNEAGKPVRMMGGMMDITERKKAEEALINNELRFRTLTGNAPVGIFQTDAAGKTTYVNETWLAYTGMTFDEALGDGWIEAVHPDDRQRLSKEWYAKAEKGLESSSEYRLIDKKGNTRWVAGKAVPLFNKSGEITGHMGTLSDVTERRKAEAELEQSYKSIRQLTDHLQNIREEERTHIAREIHDELGQQLTVLKMDISWLNKKIETTADDPVKQKMKDLLDMLNETVKTVRRISSELRPSLLDDLGLVAAMEWHLAEFEKRAGIKTSFSEPEEDIKLPDDVKTCLFRIFQESLTNVARHADAEKVKVSLEHKDEKFILRIADNGKGFDKNKIADKRTLGILGMRERTAMIGGTYDIISTPGKGTTVLVTVPLGNHT